MGCDIHLHIEVKVNGKWEHYASPWIQRNYTLFEKMAGVRGDDENAISLPKGMPEDASFITKQSCEDFGSDGHSHSYLTLNEIVQLEDWLNSLPKVEGNYLATDLEHSILHTYCEGNSFAGILRYPKEKPSWIEDTRFVFWFDN